MYHYRKTMQVYRRRKESAGCPFCNPKTLAKSVRETEHLYVVPNLTQYDLWELHKVTDHLLVVPKKHSEKLIELSSAARAGVMEVLAEYEAKGYNIYGRATTNARRSVAHQHIHLIKTAGKQANGAVFLKKPYFLVTW